MRTLTTALAIGALLVAAGSASAQEQSGTISPGMTEQQVRDALGNPDNRSARGPFTYYFYENNCQRHCGMADLVIFQGGQVIDAILRADWRTYSGESSSPNGIAPTPTPMRLQMPDGGQGQQGQGQVQGIEVRPAGQPSDQEDAMPMQPDTSAADTTSDNGG